ncbi:MAG: hypothetical protein H6737_21720 [Alphaproteobacteria bacterium]|nr:hypothetical protein [Alphaproteobacteria bacterium]
MARGWAVTAVAVVGVATLACGGFGEQTADVGHPQQFEEAGLVFGYPGNWTASSEIETNPSGEVLSVTVHSPGDALAIVQHYPENDVPTVDFAMQIMLETMTSAIEDGTAGTMKLAPPVVTSDTRVVAGQQRDVRVAKYTLAVLGVEVPHRMRIYGVDDVIVITNVADEDAMMVQPGFDQILDSLVVP